jgi:hypothetical protein
MLRGGPAPDRRGLNEITSSAGCHQLLLPGMSNCTLMVSVICTVSVEICCFQQLNWHCVCRSFSGGRRADQILMLNYLEIKLSECQWKSGAHFVFLKHRKLMNG